MLLVPTKNIKTLYKVLIKTCQLLKLRNLSQIGTLIIKQLKKVHQCNKKYRQNRWVPIYLGSYTFLPKNFARRGKQRHVSAPHLGNLKPGSVSFIPSSFPLSPLFGVSPRTTTLARSPSPPFLRKTTVSFKGRLYFSELFLHWYFTLKSLAFFTL